MSTHSVASAGSSLRLRSRRTNASYMLKSNDETNRSLRACGSIVVGSPSFAQRKVLASPLVASATSTANAAHKRKRPSLLVIPQQPCSSSFARTQQVPGQLHFHANFGQKQAGKRQSLTRRGTTSGYFVLHVSQLKKRDRAAAGRPRHPRDDRMQGGRQRVRIRPRPVRHLSRATG